MPLLNRLLHLQLHHHRRSCALYKMSLRHYRTAGYVYGHRECEQEHQKQQPGHEQHLAASAQIEMRCHPVARRLVDLYRSHGHRQAALDPLGLDVGEPDQELSALVEAVRADAALADASLQSDAVGPDFRLDEARVQPSTLAGLASRLEALYCGQLSAEFAHLPSWQERQWFARRFESASNQQEELTPSRAELTRMAELMSRSQIMDEFLGTKFASVKRYGGEGCESLLVAVERLIERGCSRFGLANIVIGTAHRGRNNLLTVLLDLPPHLYFRKMRGLSEFPDGCTDSEGFTGDTFSHYFQSVAKTYGNDGRSVTVSLIPNPSHLEACVPVAVGKMRSKMQRLGEGDYAEDAVAGSASRNGDSTCCLLIHGDASVVGQGIVYETLAMAQVPHFNVGGTVHIVVNNQVGYTTPADRGSSFLHCTDVGKSLGAPVLHVNADNPVEVSRAASLAMDYRQQFRRDIFINLVCYRRWGHNELDEPSFTQPIMYKAIRSRQSTADKFLASLDADSQAQVAASCSEWRRHLADELGRSETVKIERYVRKDAWSGIDVPQRRLTVWDTGYDVQELKRVAQASVAVPQGFELHPTLAKAHVARRLERLATDTNMDWATAECLAIGSLMLQGKHCRISGQDVGRGTFSHRHLMLVDQAKSDIDVPLNRLAGAAGRLELANSILSEEAVLGFEFGMAMDHPDRLCLWEAQFGDFFNGAQIIADTFLGSSEAKWGHQNALVLLLPHGYDGAGPEHSSCRLERWLQLTDSSETDPDTDMVNLQVVNPTTPAQYFHVLRRQLVGRTYRKPLVVVSPKTLLRHPAAVSPLSDLAPGTHFRHVLPDPSVVGSSSASTAASKISRVVLCSGKHYYALDEYRRGRGISDTALIRVEQLAPFPVHEIHAQLASFPAARSVVWSQEEPRNMGAWAFVAARLSHQLGLAGGAAALKYAGRRELPTPAVGIGALHKAEAEQVMADTFNC